MSSGRGISFKDLAIAIVATTAACFGVFMCMRIYHIVDFAPSRCYNGIGVNSLNATDHFMLCIYTMWMIIPMAVVINFSIAILYFIESRIIRVYIENIASGVFNNSRH